MKYWVPGLFILCVSCGSPQPQTAADCEMQFMKQPFAAAPNERVQFEYLYEYRNMEDVPAEARKSFVKGTISHGRSEEALKAFMEGPVPSTGAVLFADDKVYFRTSGPVSDWKGGVAAGCKGVQPGGSLLHVKAHMIKA